MQRKYTLSILVTLLIVFTALAAILFVEYQNNQRREPNFPFTPRQYMPNPADIELFYMAHTVFSTINIVLTIILIINYVSLYLKTKSPFTVGLLLFASFFLIKDITWSPFVTGGIGFFLFGLGPFAFLPDVFEMVGLLVLFYLSVKY
jgi:hypothetical protein